MNTESIFHENVVADENHLARLQVTNHAHFIGYPGTRGKPWWDESTELPISRSATLASIPSVPFKHANIGTADVGLVSGMSFSGSSGSPVFNEAVGIKPGGDIHDPNYLPARVLGIMSGHFWDEGETPEMFRHTGLSYFTRGPTMLELINMARSKDYKA